MNTHNPKQTKQKSSPSLLEKENSLEHIATQLRKSQYLSVLVTGPQRAGTTIAARILADTLNKKYVDELEIGTNDYGRAVDMLERINNNQPNGVVLQAPGLCYLAHIFDQPVVMVHRPIDDIIKSQLRIGWQQYEQAAREDYFNNTFQTFKILQYARHTEIPISMLKYQVWNSHQIFHRATLQKESYNLDYKSLESHPLFIQPENRKHFAPKQWKQDWKPGPLELQ